MQKLSCEEGDKTFTVRMPYSLYEISKELARESDMSHAKWITVAVIEKIDRSDRRSEAPKMGAKP